MTHVQRCCFNKRNLFGFFAVLVAVAVVVAKAPYAYYTVAQEKWATIDLFTDTAAIVN